MTVVRWHVKVYAVDRTAKVRDGPSQADWFVDCGIER